MLIQLLGISDKDQASQHVALVGTGENELLPLFKIKFWDLGKQSGGSEKNFKEDIRSLSGGTDL